MTDNLFKNKYRILSTRLERWDYSQNGFYFVTICIKNRECTFRRIEQGKMIISDIGKIAEQCWREIPVHFPFVKLDEFVIMPNHVHGIIVIDKNDDADMANPNGRDVACCRGVACNVSTTTETTQFSHISPKRGSLSSVTRSYKSAVTKLVNEKFPNQSFSWQSRFYDRIIRDEKEL